MNATITRQTRYTETSRSSKIRVFIDYPKGFLETDEMSLLDYEIFPPTDNKKALTEYYVKSRRRFFREAEFEADIKAARRRDIKKVRPFLKKVLEQLHVPADTKFYWSPKAGCSCGCSPGWIINWTCWNNGVWVKLTEE